MKKTFRRALSLTIASGLTLAMAVTAGAAEGDTLTRGEMAKLLVEGAGLTDQVAQYQSQTSVFSDVAEDSEYKGYINLAYAQRHRRRHFQPGRPDHPGGSCRRHHAVCRRP